jgi:hypothetical protein
MKFLTPFSDESFICAWIASTVDRGSGDIAALFR